MIGTLLGVALVAVTFAAIKFLVGNEKVFLYIVLLLTWILMIIYMPGLAAALAGIALFAVFVRAVGRHGRGIGIVLLWIVAIALLAPLSRWLGTVSIINGTTIGAGLACLALILGAIWYNSAGKRRQALLASETSLREEQGLKSRTPLQVALDEAAERLHRENEEVEHTERVRKEMDERQGCG